MNRLEIEKILTAPGSGDDDRAAWIDFCAMIEQTSRVYSRDTLLLLWDSYSNGYRLGRKQRDRVAEMTLALMVQQLFVAEAVRDDARASSQRYLDEKREADARADIFQFNMENLYALRDMMRGLGNDFTVEPKEPFSKKGARDLNEILSTARDLVKKL